MFNLTMNRAILFVDGMHIYHLARNMDIEVDYKRLFKFFSESVPIVRAHYYNTMLESDEHNPVKPLTDWLGYNGYMVTIKRAVERTDGDGRRRVVGDYSVNMAVDMLRAAYLKHADHFIFMGSDNDMLPVFEEVSRQGVGITMVSSIKIKGAFVSEVLRRAADEFIDLTDIATMINRLGDVKAKPAKAT